MLTLTPTEQGMQLENAFVLSQKQLEIAKIPANFKRIKAFAKDGHVNVSIDEDADLNCTIGVMLQEKTSMESLETMKQMLENFESQLKNFIDVNLAPIIDFKPGVKDLKESGDAEEHVRKVADRIKGFKEELLKEYPDIGIAAIVVVRNCGAGYVDNIDPRFTALVLKDVTETD